jgi:pilus assembly protein FimV
VLPTIETPRLGSDSTADTQELTIDTPRLAGDVSGDTQELTVDSLGLDLGTLRDLESLDADEATAAHKRSGGDTLEMPQVKGDKGSLDDTADMLSSTSLTRMLGDDTAQMRRDETLEGLVDLSEATGELPALDIDLGAVDSQSNLNPTGIFDLGSEPATMSEVGTKLDLARAYMDMGDPEGARSILDEVLQEGNPNQRQEAERLIASLP